MKITRKELTGLIESFLLKEDEMKTDSKELKKPQVSGMEYFRKKFKKYNDSKKKMPNGDLLIKVPMFHPDWHDEKGSFVVEDLNDGKPVNVALCIYTGFHTGFREEPKMARHSRFTTNWLLRDKGSLITVKSKSGGSSETFPTPKYKNNFDADFFGRLKTGLKLEPGEYTIEFIGNLDS